MSPKLKIFLIQWINNTVAVFVAANIVKGIHYTDFLGLVTGAFLLGILNTFIRPALRLLSLPLIIFSLGLFFFVINALMLYMVGSLLTNFRIDSFKAAFWGGLVISFISLVLNSLTGVGGSRFRFQRGVRPPPPPNKPDDKGGPIIDV